MDSSLYRYVLGEPMSFSRLLALCNSFRKSPTYFSPSAKERLWQPPLDTLDEQAGSDYCYTHTPREGRGRETADDRHLGRNGLEVVVFPAARDMCVWVYICNTVRAKSRRWHWR